MQTKSIFGPPGTGKTQHLVDLIATLPMDNTAVLSFSRSAARELTARVDGKPKFIGTIHSLCYRELQVQKGQIVNAQKFANFITADEEDIEWALQVGGIAERSNQDIGVCYMKHIDKSPISFNLFQFYFI